MTTSPSHLSSSDQYPCHAYHEDLANGKASGTVLAHSSGLVFSIDGKQITVPYAGCKLELGGANDRILFFRHPMVPDWTFYSNDRSILNHPALKAHPDLIAQVRRVRRKRTRNAVIVSTVLLIIIGTPVFLLTQMDWVSKQVAKEIPVEWETTLGESSIEQLTLATDLMAKERGENLLRPLVQPLLTELGDSRYQYNFYIAHEPTTNAFALPGGYVVIHSELILEADSAEELLGVLAHEISHVEQQHGVRNVIGTAGIYVLFGALFGDVEGLLGLITSAAPFLLNQSYSRDFEREADRLGYELLVDANINPRGLAHFFEKMLAEKEEHSTGTEAGSGSEGSEGNMANDVLAFLSTHPASEERIEYLNEMATETDQNFESFESEFDQLKRAVQDFVAEQEDKE